ncbi:vacuolar ATPase assembly integral membrane protein vma21 [Allomyces arbusculus]|nr:vacuolar ATPase assembly integral membrane protein vma21 [Allomyces arbusculus]
MPTRVVIKLILFSMLLFVVPFSTYFLTLHHLFPGNMTYSAFAAAISANVVLLGYVIVAVTEGDPTPDTDTTAKKTQ